jgi:hypothetical protein
MSEAYQVEAFNNDSGYSDVPDDFGDRPHLPFIFSSQDFDRVTPQYVPLVPLKHRLDCFLDHPHNQSPPTQGALEGSSRDVQKARLGLRLVQGRKMSLDSK